MLPVPLNPRALGALQRVLLVALLTPVVLIAVVASIPALVILPFLPGGTQRSIQLVRAHTASARTILTTSRSDSPR
ncbi:dTMP kinase [Streptacidiphilus sp. N1-12]|uniref:dTMP kinase n=2 Tax=Streptacidiphilus alkalitolerans TaxID=3342712 RepID=A0ABV6WDD9_9ACTN